jgi:hypothetical protein
MNWENTEIRTEFCGGTFWRLHLKSKIEVESQKFILPLSMLQANFSVRNINTETMNIFGV